MKITKNQLRRIVREEKAKLVTEAPNIPDVMGAIGGGKFQPRHEVIEVVDGEWGDVLFFSDRPVKLSADGPSRKPASDIGDWNALVKDLKLRPEDITDTLIVQEPGHSMYELSHDEFAALELALEKENNPSLKNVSYTPDMQREGKTMKITENQLRKVIRKELLREMTSREFAVIRGELLNGQYDVVSDNSSYPYGRYRGDEVRKTVYARKDGQPVSDEDLKVLQDFDAAVRKEGGSMAALSGIYTTSRSKDGMQLVVDYYRHTSD